MNKCVLHGNIKKYWVDLLENRIGGNIGVGAVYTIVTGTVSDISSYMPKICVGLSDILSYA